MEEAGRVLEADLADIPGGMDKLSFHAGQMETLDGATRS